MPKLVSSWAASALLRLAKFQITESRGERFLRLAADARSRITEIRPEEAESVAKQGAILIDVREKAEFHRGHIPGALHLPRGLIELEIEKRISDVSTNIVVYCGGGNRSALVAENLQRMGYTRVASVAGGFQAWLEAGFPAWRNSQFIED